jgi:hypothetical protein
MSDKDKRFKINMCLLRTSREYFRNTETRTYENEIFVDLIILYLIFADTPNFISFFLPHPLLLLSLLLQNMAPNPNFWKESENKTLYATG